MIWRPLSEADAAVIATACVGFDPYLTLGYRAETLRLYLTRTDATLERFAILQDQALAGVVCLRRPWLRGPMIEMMALLPGAQGQGLGTSVIERCQKDCGKNLWATVSAFHLPARQFYQRQGFKELCAIDGLIAPQEDEILLRWRSDDGE